MLKRKKVISLIICSAILLIIGTLTAFAAYGEKITVSITGENKFQKTDMYGTRTCQSEDWHLFVENKTMWSTPSARLVNSNDEVRSDTIQISEKEITLCGKVYSSVSNGHFYYLSVKPSSFQIGTDDITGKVSPD